MTKHSAMRGEPQGMAKEIIVGLGSSGRSEPVFAVGKIVEVIRQQPADTDNGGNEQREAQAKQSHPPQMSVAAHPPIGLTAAVEMGGDA